MHCLCQPKVGAQWAKDQIFWEGHKNFEKFKVVISLNFVAFYKNPNFHIYGFLQDLSEKLKNISDFYYKKCISDTSDSKQMGLKFRYCEKPHKIRKNIQPFSKLLCNFKKKKEDLFKKIVAFSEYINFEFKDVWIFEKCSTVKWLSILSPPLEFTRWQTWLNYHITIARVFAKFSAQADWQTRLRCDLLDSTQPAPHCKMSHHDNETACVQKKKN